MKYTNKIAQFSGQFLGNLGFLKVAAAVPRLRVADLVFNLEQIENLAQTASQAGARVVVFPELSLTGYSLGDLFQQRLVLDKVVMGLERLRAFSRSLNSLLVVGAPLAVNGKVFNTAVVLARGKFLGVVPKTFLPNYKKFY